MKPCFIDIHCHLEAVDDIPNAVKNAKKNDVVIILTQGTDVKTNREALKLAEKYDNVKACLGIYPIDALKMKDDEIEKEIEFMRKNKDKIVGIGEVGMDFKGMEPSFQTSLEHDRQREIFTDFIELAIELDKPIIVHSRKAEKECIELLEKMNAKKVIMHCFCGNRKLVERIIANKWFLTIPTSVKNAQQFQDNAKIVPIEQLFCETDSPYLHPDKLRNNTPENVIVSYEKIAKLKKMKLDDVKDKMYENYMKLFKI